MSGEEKDCAREGCGRKFNPNTPKQKYCGSSECNKERWRIRDEKRVGRKKTPRKKHPAKAKKHPKTKREPDRKVKSSGRRHVVLKPFTLSPGTILNEEDGKSLIQNYPDSFLLLRE